MSINILLNLLLLQLSGGSLIANIHEIGKNQTLDKCSKYIRQ